MPDCCAAYCANKAVFLMKLYAEGYEDRFWVLCGKHLDNQLERMDPELRPHVEVTGLRDREEEVTED